MKHLMSTYLCVGFWLLALAVATSTASAAPGDLDTTFDPGQVLWEGFDFPAFKYAAVLQPDGKVVIGGHFDTVGSESRIFIARLNTDGSLDNTFTSPFQVITVDGFRSGEVYDIIQRPDGKFYVSGYFSVGGVWKTVVLLNNDGSIDSSFNVTTNNGETNFNHIYRMMLQPDGKLIIGSNSLYAVNGVTTNSIARITPTGTLDNPLGVPANIVMAVFALALQTDGKIVIGGGNGGGGVVVRINSDGSEDDTFSIPDIGLVSVDSLAIEQDGQILVGARGRLNVNGSPADGLIRLNPNGSFDLSFNPPDIRTAWTLYVQEDGKIAVGGSFTINFGLFLSTFGRLNPDGSLDFICNSGPDNDLQDIVRQPDGKYIVVGTFENFYQGNNPVVRTGVARIFEASTPLAGKIVYNSRPNGITLDVMSINADGSNQTPLTTIDDASDYEPSLSSDGTKITFVSNRDGDEDVYIMNSDGSGQTALTVNDAIEISPAFSPDGTKIVFASQRDGNYEIYSMDANGTNQTRLTNNAFRDDEPSFSPDGTKIVFASQRDGNDEIYVMNADGSNQARLTFNSSLDTQPAFSPDGSRIVFSSFRDGNSEIYVMSTNGSRQFNISNHPSADLHPTFSPDGSRIAFATNRDGAGAPGHEIYIMNAYGSNPVRYTNNSVEDGRPSWSGAGGGPSPPPS